jgi:hypothetical protein
MRYALMCLVLAACSRGGGGGRLYQGEEEPTTKPAPTVAVPPRAVPVPPISTDITAIDRDFNENPVAADMKYRGRRVVFVQLPYGVEVDNDGTAVVAFIGAPGAMCRVREDYKSVAAKISRDAMVAVAVNCRYAGRSRVLEFDDCAVVIADK